MFRSRFLLTAAVAVAAALAAPATSQAAFEIRVDVYNATTNTLVSTETLSDGGTGSINTGTINNFDGNAGLMVNIQGMQSQIGVVNLSRLNQTNADIQNTGATALRIVVTSSATNYNLPVDTPTFSISGRAVWNDSFGTVTFPNNPAYAAWYNPNNTLNATQTQIVSLTTITQASTGNVIQAPATLPFSLTQTIDFTLASGSGVSGLTGTVNVVNAVPAPTGLVMLAGALPFVGLLRLRRRVQTATPATAA